LPCLALPSLAYPLEHICITDWLVGYCLEMVNIS